MGYRFRHVLVANSIFAKIRKNYKGTTLLFLVANFFQHRFWWFWWQFWRILLPHGAAFQFWDKVRSYAKNRARSKQKNFGPKKKMTPQISQGPEFKSGLPLVRNMTNQYISFCWVQSTSTCTFVNLETAKSTSTWILKFSTEVQNYIQKYECTEYIPKKIFNQLIWW